MTLRIEYTAPSRINHGTTRVWNWLKSVIEVLSEVWLAVNHAPVPLSLLGIAIFLLGYAIACWYYRRELRVLTALGAVLEQRIKSHDQENARLAALLQPKSGKAFSAIHRAPSHKLDVPYSPAQVAARPDYGLLLDLGMIRIEQAAPNQTSLSSTSAAIKLWDTVVAPKQPKI